MRPKIFSQSAKTAALATLSGCIIALSACSSQPKPTQRPIVVVNTPRAGNAPAVYVVQAGDTVSKIASRYGLDYRRIGALNGLDSNYTIYTGQRLRLTDRPLSTPVVARGNYPSATYPRTVTQPVRINTPTPVATPVNNLATSQWLKPVNGSLVRAFNPAANILGNWYAASQNANVIASQAGTVLYVGSDLPEYGKLVLIQHSQDYISAYAHLGNVMVQEKQIVQAGQPIASVGYISALNQPAVEFQIRYRGSPINPSQFIH